MIIARIQVLDYIKERVFAVAPLVHGLRGDMSWKAHLLACEVAVREGHTEGCCTSKLTSNERRGMLFGPRFVDECSPRN